MTKLSGEIVDNLIFEEKILKAFDVKEYSCDDVKMKQYDSSSIWGRDELMGRNFKRFFRYNGDCFNDVKQEILTNSNCSYVTFFNDVAKNGLFPEWVSVLVKKSDKFRAYREVLASQILNYCEVPTCANVSLYVDDKNTGRNLVSIDTISENERFLSSEDLRIKNYVVGLRTWLGTFSKCLDRLPTIKKHPEMKDKILKQLAYSILIRKELLGDVDCGPWNVGILVNEKAGYIKLVNYDYESSFEPIEKIEHVDSDLDYAEKHFPEEYNKFLRKVNEIANVLSKIKLESDLIYERLNKNINYVKQHSQHIM